MEPWRVCKPVTAESYHFDEEQDPDSHQSETRDPPERICNPGCHYNQAW